MAYDARSGFRIREYEVKPDDFAIVGPGGVREVQPESMEVLLHLVAHAGEVVTPDTLLSSIGPQGSADPRIVADCIRELRAHLDDTDDSPRFIQTVGKRGYRLVAPVAPSDDVVLQTESGPLHVHPLKGGREGDYLLQSSIGPLVVHPVGGDKEAESPDEGLFATLQRKRVFRVVAAYAVVAWLLLQIVDVISGALPVPNWTLTAATVTAAIGFPAAALLAWAFQVTPSGIKLDLDPSRESTGRFGSVLRYFDVVVIAVLLAAVALLSWGHIFQTVPADRRFTMAVLPFENLSGDPDDQYLSRGIADDIRARLYEVPQLLIAASRSSRALFEQNLDIRSIGERLGVEHVLEGSVRRSGDRLKVSVQLVDVATGFNRWSKTYNPPVDDILDMQNDISLVVASELEMLLSPELRELLANDPTDDPLAYDYYLQARNFRQRPLNDENLRLAQDYFERAIREDEDFALAYAGLCQTYIAKYRLTGNTRHVGDAESNCRRALAIDRRLSEVHTALGELYMSTGALEQAESGFRRAIDIDPRSVEAHTGLGDLYARRQQPKEAEEWYRTSIRLLPGNWDGYNHYARFLLTHGRFREAIVQYRRVLELTPGNANAYNDIGAAYFLLGEFGEAAEYYRQSLQIEPGAAAYSNTGTMYYYAGDFESAATMFLEAAEEAEYDYRLWGNLADAERFVAGKTARETYLKAVELAMRQLEVNPGDDAVLTNLAWYHVNIGNLAEARRFLSRARALESSDAEQLYTSALVLTLLGEQGAAQAAMLKAMNLGFPAAIVEATPELGNIDLTGAAGGEEQ